MTQQEFYNKLNNSKTSFSQKETADLNNIISEFPYFQAASFILMKALYNNNSSQYKSKLAHTAANIPNREQLFNFIYSEYSIQNNHTEKSSPSKPLNTTIKSSKEITKPQALQNKKGEDIKSKADLIKEVKDRLDELKEEEKATPPPQKAEIKAEIKTKPKKQDTPKIEKADDKTSKKNSTSTLRKTKANQTTAKKEDPKKISKPIDRGSSIDIVEKFIKNKPNINRPDDKEYNEEIKLANKSINEDYDLVSETMAKLFIKQGHKEKAIKIYEKLILIYPEKNTYFAARISELNN